jgi:hypothetical protein
LSDSTIRRLLKRLGFSQKTDCGGALERDEWLRAAWRVLVLRKMDSKRLVFLETRWALTLRLRPCAPGRGVESGHAVRYAP